MKGMSGFSKLGCLGGLPWEIRHSNTAVILILKPLSRRQLPALGAGLIMDSFLGYPTGVSWPWT